MTSQDFHREYPGYSHRLAVKKTHSGLQPLAVEVSTWMKDTFGPRGVRWQRQPMASPDYLVYWFKDERDLVWSELRWR